jgi:hypothetical protein
MSEKYFGNRQNGTKAPEEEMERIFKCIADHFSLKWIKSKRSHPLQKLWNRKDILATNELYFFGSCLQRMAAINSKWTRSQVQQIKSDQSNNQLGAFFEINGLGLLNSLQQRTHPATGNNPGFDGTLILDETRAMRLSLKNYGDSYYYKEFENWGKKVEECVQKVIKEKRIKPLQIIIDAVKGFPGKAEWESLIQNIPIVFDQIESASSNSFAIDDFWLFMYGDIKDDEQEFHPAYNSYQLILLSPYDKNEEKNMLSKLEGACANLTKHSRFENESIINAVFIHLPELASMEKCFEWSEQYFINFPDKPVTCIILYQPVVAVYLDKDVNFIHHCFRFLTRRDKYKVWNPQSKQVNFEIPVGILSMESSVNKMIAVIGSERKEFDLNGKYVYQRGNYFLAGKKEADGTITGNMKRVASGIFTHAVIEPFPDQPPVVLSAHYPPVDKLLIL